MFDTSEVEDKITNIAHDYSCYWLSKDILENNNFYLWSGSSKPEQHHYGKGGLAVHTLEVIENSLLMANKYNLSYIEKKSLFLAALYHDVGKMWDYKPVYPQYSVNTNYEEWEKTEHCRLIHHISRSVMVFNENCSDYSDKDSVIHCILSHHGQREWGSPVQPRTKIAWILHLCDGLSARITDCGGMHV